MCVYNDNNGNIADVKLGCVTPKQLKDTKTPTGTAESCDKWSCVF